MTGGSDKRKRSGKTQVTSHSDIFSKVDADLESWQRSEDSVAKSLGKADERDEKRPIYAALLSISASINSTFNQRELLKKIIDAVILATDCDRGFLMLRNQDGELTFSIARSKEEKELDEGAFKVSRSIVQRAAETGVPVVQDDIQNSNNFKHQQSVRDLKLQSAYGIPLKYEDRLVGIIYVDSNRISQSFSRDDLPILEAFGAQAAVAIENARKRGELELSVQKLKKQLSGQGEFFGIVGRSKVIQDVIEKIKMVAPFSTSVLIQGEQGTGKELVAKAIHANSPRGGKTFIAINCGAIAEGLLESELFGHVKGSFTGAIEDRKGAFEEASGGTLFLDEIGEMQQKLQVKLLRVLQENEITPVGSNETRKVDVRIISATNKDLTKEVGENRFRGDLYYRLNVMPINIPPLRERQEDIMVLAEHFLEKHARLNELSKPRLTHDARKFLLNFDWPGNVRELENRIERAVVICHKSGIIDAVALEQNITETNAATSFEEGGTLKEMLDIREAKILRKTLVTHGWNVTKAAETLGISRQILHTKIKKYGLSQNH